MGTGGDNGGEGVLERQSVIQTKEAIIRQPGHLVSFFVSLPTYPPQYYQEQPSLGPFSPPLVLRPSEETRGSYYSSCFSNTLTSFLSNQPCSLFPFRGTSPILDRGHTRVGMETCPYFTKVSSYVSRSSCFSTLALIFPLSKRGFLVLLSS